MPFADRRYKGVRTEDHETYMGYPSEYMHNTKQQKSKVYGGDMLDLENRKQLKHYHQTAIARDINNVKKRRS